MSHALTLHRIINLRFIKNSVTLYILYFFDLLFRRNKFIFQGRRIQRTERLAQPQPKKILFPTIYYLDQALGWQSSIAKTLQVRGHEVLFLPINIRFPRKNSLYFDVFDGKFAAASAELYTTTLLRGLGLPFRKLTEFSSHDFFTKHRLHVQHLTLAECRTFTYHHLPLGAMALNSVIHFYRRGVRSFTQTEIEGYKDFIAIGMVLYHALTQALDSIRPDIIMTLNGSFLDSQIQLKLAQQRSIRVITFEAGFMLNSILLGENEPLITFPMMRSMPPAYQTYQLSAQQNKELDDYLIQRSFGKNCVLDYWGKPIFDKQVIYKELNMSPGTPLDILFTNLEWDSTLIDCDIAFDSQIDWICEVIKYYQKNPQRALIIRIHPAEVTPPTLASHDKIRTMISQRYPTLPPNVRVLDPTSKISSYPLTSIARRVLVYASTAGLEAAMMRKPVLLAGKVHYRGCGFTTDIERSSDLSRLLDDDRYREPTQATQATARKYGYFFFFRYHVPLHTVSEGSASSSRDLTRFTITSESELLPGADANMDFIIDYILGKRNFKKRFNETIHGQPNV